MTKKIEMAFVKDIHSTDFIDLSSYILPKETEIEHREKTLYTYQLGAFEENEIDETKLIVGKFLEAEKNGEPVGNLQEIMFAGFSQSKIYFQRESNTFRHSYLNKDTNIWEWGFYSGNVKKIKHSNSTQKWENEINEKPNVKVPTQIFNSYYGD